VLSEGSSNGIWRKRVMVGARSEQARTQDDGPRPSPSRRSLLGLDGLNFLMADVRDGLGPFLSVYLKDAQHWGAGNIGLAMAASGVAAAICQMPAGLLVDAVRAKRLLVAISGLLVGAGCVLIALFPKFPAVLAAQIALGGASAIIPPVPRRVEPGPGRPSLAASPDRPE
jgi:hypothetical protein